MNEEPQSEERTFVQNGIVIKIPKCCSEGREDCPHAVQKERIAKRNVGL